MLEISHKASLRLSKILCAAAILCIIVAVFFVSRFIDIYFFGKSSEFLFIAKITLYLSLLPALPSLFSLFVLLNNIEKGEVFIRLNTRILRFISWCAFFVGILHFVSGFWFPSFFIVSFAGMFAFLILRVLKNVFVTAMQLKEENDFTI